MADLRSALTSRPVPVQRAFSPVQVPQSKGTADIVLAFEELGEQAAKRKQEERLRAAEAFNDAMKTVADIYLKRREQDLSVAKDNATIELLKAKEKREGALTERLYTLLPKEEAAIGGLAAQRNAAALAQPEKQKQTLSKNEDVLRKEFMSKSRNFLQVRDSFMRVKKSAKDPSAAGDLSLIFAYMKMLDPESVVRESEQASATNARGVPDAIRNVYNRILAGEKLAPAQRLDFLNRARGIASGQLESHNALESEYSRIAVERGLQPERVVVDLKTGITVDGQSGISGDMKERARKRLQELRKGKR